jgi:hypothetical protein
VYPPLSLGIKKVIVHLGSKKPSFSPPGHASVVSEGRLSLQRIFGKSVTLQCRPFGGQKLGFWAPPERLLKKIVNLHERKTIGDQI